MRPLARGRGFARVGVPCAGDAAVQTRSRPELSRRGHRIVPNGCIAIHSRSDSRHKSISARHRCCLPEPPDPAAWPPPGPSSRAIILRPCYARVIDQAIWTTKCVGTLWAARRSAERPDRSETPCPGLDPCAESIRFQCLPLLQITANFATHSVGMKRPRRTRPGTPRRGRWDRHRAQIFGMLRQQGVFPLTRMGTMARPWGKGVRDNVIWLSSK
jgi:hypothetical protein